MKTVEKLLVQIFERKNAIIKQVRQQTELYSQHLASKLFIDGITPPAWLWDGNTSSNSKEINKEELISKLLCPHPQPSIRYSFANYPLYENLATTGDNEAFSEKRFMESMVFDKGHHRQDDPTVTELSREDHVGCAIDIARETDASVTSPEDQRNERILNIFSVDERSLSRIQRSRSRQKALELRNSAKSQPKSCSSHENLGNSLSNGIRFSLPSTDPKGQKNDVANLTESGVVGGPAAIRDSIILGCSSEQCIENASGHAAVVRERGSMHSSTFEHGGNNANKGQLVSNSLESENLGSSLLQDSAKEPIADSCHSIIREVQTNNSICVLEKIDTLSAHEIESTFSSQKTEGAFCYKEKNMENNLSSLINTEQCSTKMEARNSQGCLSERTSTLHPSSNDAKEACGRQTIEKEMLYLDSTHDRNSQTLSFSMSESRKTKESINSSNSKPTLSNKASLKRQDQKLSLRESRANNIALNVTSFLPLVQQKKVATVFTGKRDVKVKALEAAKVAKRLEEKRENDRRMRKEALKAERAKLVEKNTRNMEFEKKRKEEERKKRDAVNMAKKRLMEEEARKEKEKNRMKLETRQRQREQGEKLRAEKGEQEKQQPKDDQMNRKKELQNESEKQLNMDMSKGDGITLKQTETKQPATNVVMSYDECGTFGASCEAEMAIHMVDTSPNKEDLIVQNSHGKSYEISPYQCSDDDDEEEDELPTKKYIPPWTSKNSVALLLPLQQNINPDLVFPSKSFCSIDEVLLPRKLQQKEAAL